MENTLESLLEQANANALEFLAEAESLSLKKIEAFRTGREEDPNVLVAILSQHFQALSQLANFIGRSINDLTDGAVTDQMLLARFTQIFLEADSEEEASPIILLN